MDLLDRLLMSVAMKPYVALLLTIALNACGGGASAGSVGAPPSGPLIVTPTATPTAPTGSVPIVSGCQIFPSDNPWNTDISNYPLDPNSAIYINTILNDGSGQTNLHPDFGQDPTYGIPFVIVPQNQPTVPVTFTYADQSDPGPYPIPPNVPIEGGPSASGDRHVLVLQQGTCSLYEMWDSQPVGGGTSWTAGSGALFNLNSNALRRDGWTSADAAGLPIFPALVKCQEVAAGSIDHALRVSFQNSQSGFIHPATHDAGTNNPYYPPMGLRLRLKSNYDISGFTGASKIILTAMKTYGMFVADNGSDWYFQGEGTGNNPSSCWNDDDLNQLKSVPGSAFEVVETGQILH
jgi:hypothetical protein